MNATPFDLAQALRSAVSGTGVHIDPRYVLDEIDWNVAGSKPSGAPHSIFQIVNHLIYWQQLLLSGMTASQISPPATAAEGWPGPVSPKSDKEWQDVVRSFSSGCDEVSEAIESTDPSVAVPAHEPTKRANVINTIAIHTSYHLGQIVLLRKQLGSWPPPKGAHTW